MYTGHYIDHELVQGYRRQTVRQGGQRKDAEKTDALSFDDWRCGCAERNFCGDYPLFNTAYQGTDVLHCMSMWAITENVWEEQLKAEIPQMKTLMRMNILTTGRIRKKFAEEAPDGRSHRESTDSGMKIYLKRFTVRIF